MTRRTILGTLAATAAVAVITGCGSSSTATKTTTPAATQPTTTTPTTPAANYGKQYEQIVAPANAALDAANAKMSKNATYTLDQVVGIFKPAVTAATTMDNQLLRTTWPANAQADIKTLVRDDTALSLILAGSSGTAAGFNTEVGPAAAKVAGDVNVVRADLGLPPAPTS